jgi:hypothetical protein
MKKVSRLHPEFKQDVFWKVVNRETSKSVVREMIDKGYRQVEVVGNGGRSTVSNDLVSEMTDPEGGLAYFEYPAGRKDPTRPIIREMIDTSQGQMALLEKVRIDVAFGLADVPLLYGDLYDRIAPAGGFPGGLYQIDENTLQANVVFLQKFEGGEVEFGTLEKGAPSVGTIQTYAAGFEWTEDMIEFDKTWSIEENTRAFGRAYNALLNHLHLSPIIGYSYGSDNSTPYNSSGSTTIEDIHLTLQDAYRESVVPATGPRRTGTVLLASEADRFNIESAILTPVLDAQGNALPNVPITAIVYYDGDEIVVGEDTYTYPGVTPGECYLIFPKRKLKELVHHDLRIDVGPPDISRLVEGQQVGRTRRSVFASLTESVEKVDISA